MHEPFRELPLGSRTFTIVLAAIYVGAAILALPHSRPEVTIGLIGIFALAGLIRPVPNPFGGITDPVTGVVIVAALLWLPWEVLLGVGVGSFIGLLFFRKNEVWRATNNGAGWGLPAGAAAIATHFTISTLGSGPFSSVVAGALAIVVNRIINTLIFAIYRTQRFGHPFFSTWHQMITYIWPNQFLPAPLAVALSHIATRIASTEWGLILTFASGTVLPVTRREYTYYISSQKMLDEIVEALVRTLDGVHHAAREHGDRISALAVETGRKLGMSERSLMALRLACRLHDVGLLAGPEEGGSGQKNHAIVGKRILTRFPDPLIAEMVGALHERWDGTGVPDQRSGKAIPLGARVLAACEIYDNAVSGFAPFEKPLPSQEAVSHLISISGTVLDPSVAKALLHIISDRSADRAAG